MMRPTNPNSPLNMLIHGLSGVVGLLLAVLPSAWGQLEPTASNRLPGQSISENIYTPASTADRSRPLIAFRRDEQEPQATMAPSHHQPAIVGQRDTRIHDQSIVPAVHVATPAEHPTEIPKQLPPNPEMGTNQLATLSQLNANDPRRLLPSSKNGSSIHTKNQAVNQTPANVNRMSGIARTFPSVNVLRTTGTGLGIALGLMMLCIWLFRRNAPSPTTPLPKEVVSVLGRSQLATRQFVQLLRVGNKLVLVSVTPEGTEPITEVTDPIEVDRLLGLCMHNHSQSTTAEFQQVLSQLSREGAKGFLGKK